MRCFIIACFIGLFICISLWAQEVAIYFDPAKGEAWINQANMATAVETELKAKNIKCNIVNAKALVEYMEANKEGIVIITSGLAPGEIFQNRGDKDLVHKWLFDGGVMFWTGDWPFYYWDTPANVPAAAGEVSVFGVTVTQSAVSQMMKPTDIGKELIPSIGVILT